MIYYDDSVAFLGDLLRQKGHARYGAEPVSQLQHALQCAALAERASADPALIAAALLHDVGHLIADDDLAAPRGIDMRHEQVAACYLEQRFSAAVVEPIRLHVDAKRYLCATEPGYFEELSFASARSLNLQGGAFGSADADLFIAKPYARDAVLLRRWDDAAKDPLVATPPLDHFLAYLPALPFAAAATP